MTQWSPQSIMGIDRSTQDNRKREKRVENYSKRLILKHKLKETSVGNQSPRISWDIFTRGTMIFTLNSQLLLSDVSYALLLLQLSVSGLFLLLFLLLFLEPLAQVVKFNTLAHALRPHLQHEHTNTHIVNT